MENNKYLSYVNVIKGIAILTVLVGHTSCPAWMAKLVYTFHMPLFFAVTGYLYNDKKWNGQFRKFVKKRAETYLIPYFLVCIGILCLNQFEYRVVDHRADAWELLWKNIYGIFYSKALSEYMINCVPLWYLTCIFVSSVIFYLVIQLKEKFGSEVFILSAVCMVCANCMIIGKGIEAFPWHVDTALFATTFMMLGYAIRKMGGLERLSMRKVIAGGVIGVIFSVINPNYVHFLTNRYGCIFFMYIGATAMIAIIWEISRRIDHSRILEFFGKNSLVIFCLNYYLDHLLVNSFGALGIDYYQVPWFIVFALILAGSTGSVLLWERIKVAFKQIHNRLLR